MKIGISLLSARAHRTGVENTVFNLLTQLTRLDGSDEYVVYADIRRLPWLSALSSRIRVVDVRLSSRHALWVWEHLFFLNSRLPREVDLIHFPIGGGVVGYRGDFILTIHDLNHYTSTELVKLRRHLLWRVWCKANIRRAATIITGSEHVKKEILQEFPIAPEKVRVIANGVDRRFGPGARVKVSNDKLQLPERYVLFVGATSANKNIKRAIEAVSLARRRWNLDHRFLIAGLPGEEDASLRMYVNRNDLQDVVRFLGYVAEEDLQHLYVNADLFLFPSITEGFGIPPLEAMRCGIPVVAGRTTSLPEVLGDAAIWVDPLSVESIAEGIRTGVQDRCARSAAIAKGFCRAEHFTWEKMALETVKVYRKVTSSQ